MHKFTDILTKQTEMMLAIARRLDERGYAILVQRLNRDGEDNRYPYTYFLGALERYFSDNGVRCGSRIPTLVSVFPSTNTGRPLGDVEIADRRKLGKVLDQPFTFQVKLPTTKRYKPLVSCLTLISRTKQGRWNSKEPEGTGPLLATKVSDYWEISGRDRSAFEILIRHFEMPQHREILVGNTSNA